MLYDTIIIGIGPAGLSAAIYTARADLKTLVLGDPQKSHLAKTDHLANYFGFPEAVKGLELLEKGVVQAKAFGTEIKETEVTEIKPGEDKTFTVKDAEQNEYQARTLILAVGMDYLQSGISNEADFIGKGVSYCVTCDGFFFNDKRLVVVGHGDFAATEAISLLSYSKDVTILSHGQKFMINADLREILEGDQEKDVKFLETESIEAFQGEGKLESIKFKDGKTMEFDGVFMALGTAGATAFANHLGLTKEGQYLVADKAGKTNIEGIFAAGDCTGTNPQVATAVGEGANAALSVIKQLKGVEKYAQYH